MEKSSKAYDKLFGLDGEGGLDKAKCALKIALDTRKFEIELYWKRTTFYWTLIAAAFAGFFLVLSVDEVKLPNKYFYSFVVACVGLLFSVAWYLVNRGSKYWQENWENHVDLLAEKIAGPIYRALVSRAEESDVKADGEEWVKKHWSERFIGPDSVSVSKINQWVSLFTIMIWFILAASAARHVIVRPRCHVILPARCRLLHPVT